MNLRRRYERFRQKRHHFNRYFAAILAGVLLAACLYTTVLAQDVVVVTDSAGASHTMLTSGMSQRDIVLMTGAITDVYDEVSVSNQHDGTANVTIEDAFTVAVEADGTLYESEMVDGVVEDLLDEHDIHLQGDDFVVPAMDTPVSPGLSIEVNRVTYEEEVLRTDVSDEHAEEYHAEILSSDPDALVSVSASDIYDVGYRHTLINGEHSESEIISLTAVVTPQDPGKDSLEPGVPHSTIDAFADVEVDENGIPTNATRVLQGASTTAYSSSGGRGASGLGLYCGTVAVNPNVIPYGTRLFITSSDQSFVYGYAIATDTGTALMAGTIDIDLYFETNAECNQFGKRAMDVYILD